MARWTCSPIAAALARPWVHCAPSLRSRRSTAALVLDVAQALLGERCGRWRWSAAHDLDAELDLAGISTRPGAVVTSSMPIAVAAALAVPARPGARCSVLAGDVAQELGRLAEGGSNLDQLAGAGAAVELARPPRGPGARPRVTRLGGDRWSRRWRWRWRRPARARGARAGRRPGAAGARAAAEGGGKHRHLRQALPAAKRRRGWYFSRIPRIRAPRASESASRAAARRAS